MEFADEELSCQSAAVLRIKCLDPTCLLGFVICNMQLHFCPKFCLNFSSSSSLYKYPWNRVSLILFFINPMTQCSTIHYERKKKTTTTTKKNSHLARPRYHPDFSFIRSISLKDYKITMVSNVCKKQLSKLQSMLF